MCWSGLAEVGLSSRNNLACQIFHEKGCGGCRFGEGFSNWRDHYNVIGY